MATNIDVSGGGYHYKFVDGEPPSDCICQKCTFVSRDPQQVSCCGNIYCKGCLEQLEDKCDYDFKCPTCHSDITHYFSDTRADRRIKSLEVYCTNRESYCLQDGSSCQWKGYLKDIDTHLQQCPYQFISCTNDCGEYVQQKQLQYHLENDCPKRLIECQYCTEEGILTGDHFEVCPQYPILCSNMGCGQKIPRIEMRAHKESCPKEITCCQYKTIGCDQKMKREEQKEHNEQSMEEHLQMAMEEILVLKKERVELNAKIKDKDEATNNKLEETEATLQAKIFSLQGGGKHSSLHQSIHIKCTGFREMKEGDKNWFSPAFYTSPGGYKMCLCIAPNGSDSGKNTNVSCGVCLMSGEYDNILEWPFQGEVTIELLNQLKNRNHYKKDISYDESIPQEARKKVVGKRYGEGWGYLLYISHSQLGYNSSLNCQYLKNDTLYFRVSVKVTSKTKPWLVGHVQ